MKQVLLLFCSAIMRMWVTLCKELRWALWGTVTVENQVEGLAHELENPETMVIVGLTKPIKY